MSIINIWCLERGSSCSSAFYVTVKSNSNIFDLKKAIFREISVSYNIKPKDLNLWKVDFNQNLSENVPFDRILKDEMKIKNATSLIRDIFYGVEGNNIRIIFEAPAITSAVICANILAGGHLLEGWYKPSEMYSDVNVTTMRYFGYRYEYDGFGCSYS
ncbi:14862_t:CDS:2, partial [Cetraspora pellucida]